MKTKQQIIDDGNAADRLLKDTDLVRFFAEIEQDCCPTFFGEIDIFGNPVKP